MARSSSIWSCPTWRRGATCSTRGRRKRCRRSCRPKSASRCCSTLTVADIRAVGPGVWNGWKGQLLRTLYWETEVVLGGGHSVDRPQGAGRSGAGDVAPLASGLVRSGVRRLRPASLPGLLAEGRAGAAGRPRQTAARDGRRDPLAGDRGHDRRVSWRDRGHRGRARPPAAPDRHRRRLRRRRGQHRRRADFHHHRRPGARHHFRLARVRARRGRVAPRPAHRRQYREDPARRGPAGRDRRRRGSRATCGAAPSRSSPK